MILVKSSSNPSDVRVVVLTLQTVLMIAIAAAAGWAIYRPARSIQDRLAGTWVVPR